MSESKMPWGWPMTKPEAEKRVYGDWAGNPKGHKYNSNQCAAEIGEYIFYQCSRKPGHGPDGLYCKQHAKMERGPR